MCVNMGSVITTAAPTVLLGSTSLDCSCCKPILLLSLSCPSSENHGRVNGVVSLIVSLIADLAKETEQAKVDGIYAQEEREAFMSESAACRAEEVRRWRSCRTVGLCVRVSDSIEGELASAVNRLVSVSTRCGTTSGESLGSLNARRLRHASHLCLNTGAKKKPASDAMGKTIQLHGCSDLTAVARHFI